MNAGLNVIASFDFDPTCQYTYEHNNNDDYINENVQNLSGGDIEELYDEGELKILVSCAPCQPFYQMRFKLGKANAQDEKYNLLLEYGRLITTIVSMENVPQIQGTNIFAEFLNILQENGYQLDYKVIYCPDYGIPQTRKRFVLVGSLLGPIEIIGPTHNRNDIHIRDFIQNLPPIGAGEVDPNDALHRSASLSERNLDRIRHSRPGGT